jgi:hypothetical protein
MADFEDYLAVFSFIAIYGTKFVDYCLAPTNNSAVSTALIVVLANASLGGNMTRIASVRAVAPAPNALGLANCEPLKMYGPVYKQLIEAQRRRKIEFFRPWPSEISLQVRTDSNFLEISNVTFSEWEEIHEHDKRIRKLHRLGRVYNRFIEAQRRRKIEFFRPWPSEISLQVRNDSNFFEISNVTFSEWEEIHEHDKRIRKLHRLGRVYNRFIEAQRRRKIEFFRPWPSEISLQVRNDSNFFEISNVTFSEWEEINERDKRNRKLHRLERVLEISNVNFSEWEEINERDKRNRKLHRLERVLEISNVNFSEWEEINENYKRIRQLHRLPTKEILPIRLLSFFYSLATQVLQQFNRVVAEVQLVVYEAFNYVSLLFLGPILVMLCCLVKCKDDRTRLCWVLKLVSKCHPISGLCVHVCDKIVDSSNHTQPPQSTVRVSDQIVDSSQPTQPPQRRVRFADEIMESPTPTQPLSSGPDGGLKKETMEEMKARLLATFKKIRSEC